MGSEAVGSGTEARSGDGAQWRQSSDDFDDPIVISVQTESNRYIDAAAECYVPPAIDSTKLRRSRVELAKCDFGGEKVGTERIPVNATMAVPISSPGVGRR